MEINKQIKFFIPLLAVVIIMESVVVISSFVTNKAKQVTEVVPLTVNDTIINPVATVVKEPAQAELVFEVNSRTMKQGVSYPVSLTMATKKDFQIDTFDLYIKYDPTAFEVANLTYDKKLGKPTFEKVSKDKGLIVANIYMNDAAGLSVKAGEDFVKLMGFNVTPKKAGNFSFEVNTGNGRVESATMIVENGTAKVIPFSSNKLDVMVTK